jgi:hypothetical protein
MISLGSSAPEKDRHVKPTGHKCISCRMLPASGVEAARFTIVGQVGASIPRCRIRERLVSAGIREIVAVLRAKSN